jgi:hypothetical protein
MRNLFLTLSDGIAETGTSRQGNGRCTSYPYSRESADHGLRPFWTIVIGLACAASSPRLNQLVSA